MLLAGNWICSTQLLPVGWCMVLIFMHDSEYQHNCIHGECSRFVETVSLALGKHEWVGSVELLAGIKCFSFQFALSAKAVRRSSITVLKNSTDYLALNIVHENVERSEES